MKYYSILKNTFRSGRKPTEADQQGALVFSAAPKATRRRVLFILALIPLLLLSGCSGASRKTEASHEPELHIHNWTEASCTAPTTCTICGATEGTANGHRWNDATCTEAQTCSVCGTEGQPALGHAVKAVTCTEPSTCTRCGETIAPAPGHDWAEATSEKPKTCLRCGLTEGKPLPSPKPEPAKKKPGKKDMVGCDAAIQRPDAANWLPEYITFEVRASMLEGGKISVWSQPDKSSIDAKRVGYQQTGCIVKAIAAENGYYLCLDGKELCIGWCKADYLIRYEPQEKNESFVWPPYPLESTDIVAPSDPSYWLANPERRTIGAENGAYQFTAPDDHAERFSTIDHGLDVLMIAQEGEYGLCVYRDQIIGWVRTRNLAW